MAEIHVQPKKRRGSLFPWLLLALGIIALTIFLLRDRDGDTRTQTVATANNDDHPTTYNNTSANAAANGWSGINWNAPSTRYDEVTDRNIEVRSADNYTIYGLGEDVLFDKGSAAIRPQAVKNLQQIASSISKRYKDGEVRVYGFTDATGGAGQNQQLSQQRADAVKSWLVQQGHLDAGRLSVEGKGESNPAATNNTEGGRQQNRRVQIVARNS